MNYKWLRSCKTKKAILSSFSLRDNDVDDDDDNNDDGDDDDDDDDV